MQRSVQEITSISSRMINICIFCGLYIYLYILGARACAGRVGSVCVSVDRYLTSEASVRPENDIKYWAMKVKIFVWISLKLLRCRDTAL